MVKKAKIKWLYEWQRQMNFFNGFWCAYVWNQRVSKSARLTFYWHKRKNCLLFAKRDDAYTYVDEAEINKISTDYLKLSSHKNFLRQYKKRVNQCYEGIKKIKIKSEDISLMPNSKLIKLFSNYYYGYLETGNLVAEIRSSNWMVNTVMENILKEKVSRFEQIEEFMSALLSSPRQSVFFKMDEDFLKLLTAVKKNPRQKDNLIKKHLNKYYWISSGFNDESGLKLSDLEAKVASGLKTIKKIKNEITNNRKLYKKLNKKSIIL